MKTAEEYVYEQYGNKHIESIFELKDAVSMIAIMQEYANYLAKECLFEASMSAVCIDNSNDNHGGYISNYEVDKDSILSIEALLP